MIPLTIIVDSLGGWLALAFILVFIVKAFLSAIGGGVDIDTDDGIKFNHKKVQTTVDGEVINILEKI